MAALFGQKYKSMALAETERSGCLILGSVDSYGHLIVSKLGNSGKAIWRTLTVKTSLKAYVFSITSRLWCRRGWMGRAVLQSKSMAAVTRSFCKSIDVYDQDIHFQTIHTLQELYRNICSFSFSHESIAPHEDEIWV
ncbi:uncharacterized protein LOC130776573 isoform X1 [Actinidia eriantha]|uniref:uncharacterized protein LOC130776573 isoform X1 n=1 Tax=Actinidia eriantha TaxID=165200 RepID=UPI00258E7ACD|nr:uncharacterized protein LOC130776573 isoform X1 [Actinidia eriantha]